MTHVFHRATDARLPVADHGDGIYIVDTEGRRYLDASGGAAVSCLGHSDADVIAAIKSQVERLPFAHTAFFTSRAAEDLAETLIDGAPDGLGRVYFLSGGSEAVEAALKMARQYFVEKGEPKRRHFIARRQSYHGNTLGALAVGGNFARREVYGPLLIETTHIAPAMRTAARSRARATPTTDFGSPMNWRTRSSAWVRRRSVRLSRKPSLVRRPVRFRRSRGTSAASARSVTVTACC